VVRKIAIILAAVAITVYGWNVLASAIFCFGVQHREFLEFPYLQWIEAASLFRVVNWQIKIWIGIAAILPSTVVLIGLTALVRYTRPARPLLYGASQWANLHQMRAGDVRRRHEPPGR
jgi:hypothetical protein